MTEGWIKIYRKITEAWIWGNPLYVKMWIDFLLRANHTKSKVLIDGVLVPVERGQFITSLKKLAMEYSVSISKIRHFLNLLKKDSMIELKTTNKFTRISICNYSTYQDSQHAESTQTAYRKKSKSTQKETDKNVKNVENEKKGIEGDPHTLWNLIFGRCRLVEEKFTNELLLKHGFTKTKKILMNLRENGFNKVATMRSSLDEDGNIKPKNSNRIISSDLDGNLKAVKSQLD